MKRLIIQFEQKFDDETVPMTISMPVNEDDQFVMLSATKEAFNDIILIAKNHGMNIFIEEE